MKPSAVLLIDLENFYCSREDYCGNGPTPGYDRVRFAYDLDKLLGFARSMSDGLSFTVRRAYANFNAARYPSSAPPQYFLRHIPDELMRQGVEPVQVFRLSQSSSKNAADMRMAMDATALLNGVGNVEHFVLVTGDADFIPVILELKRHGHAVSVIGVTGATNALIQRFVDNFELFEDLLAAEDVEAHTSELPNTGEGLAPVVTAMRKLLDRTHPLRFAAVKPLLSKELGHAFDPGMYGCDSTGEFLRKYQAELGVIIRPTQHDQEIDLPGAALPSTNGSNGSKTANRSVARPSEKQPERPSAKPGPAQPEPHSREHYYQLLAGRSNATSDAGVVRVPAVPWSIFAWSCEAIVKLLAPPTGIATHTTALLPKLIQATDGVEIPDIVKNIRMFYPILRAGLPVRGADGVYSLPPETTGEQIRCSVLSYIAYALNARLSENNIAGEIRPESLAAVFDPGPTLEQVTAEVVSALALPAPSPPPNPSSLPSKPPSAEEMHTPTGYMKLLKTGGSKGSETESFKILPVPWTSIQKVCLDVFPLLSPTVGGASHPRDQLCHRLTETGKDLSIDRYDQHVRRSLGIMRIAGDIIEEDGIIALNAEVTSPQDLRNRTLSFLLQLVQLRLEERDIFDPIRPHAFVAALEAGPLTDSLVEEVTPAIQWLYQETETNGRLVSTSQEELPVAPSPESSNGDTSSSRFDSGLVEIRTKRECDNIELPDSKMELDATTTPTPEISALGSETAWTNNVREEAFSEDGGSQPARETNTDEPQPSLASSEDPEQVQLSPLAEESPAPGSGIIDVASLTREAVAAAAIEVQTTPADAPAIQTTTNDNSRAINQEMLLAVPVADWLPEDDPLQPEGMIGKHVIITPPGAIRLIPTQPSLPDPVTSPVDNIASPPLPTTIPPPPPSESA